MSDEQYEVMDVADGRTVKCWTLGAYKDSDAVMAAQRDLVEIVATLKQVLCVQG